ncbi:hypothetical protein HFO55_22345 [Rhizobium leguminosarum]|uniref:hypothetical protein n=1 Tax=Rhizobium leguminosarum TaxID=384 RepID=UPI001C94A5B8|nr:hypothetical protein [Rhizobium leguminosarum]MBY5569969.1 hypothetical protein [Rhizobium leguminosarum]MBY5576770.1 hypothetical protein [Rhizobium leguminosarum]
MSMLLRRFDLNKCCLCGDSGNLTGEHKIKLSALRDEFGNVPLYIGGWDDPDNPPKLAQSPKSKFFHFAGKICKECNGTKTQKADRSFHEYHKAVKDSIQNERSDRWENGIFKHPDFSEHSEKSDWLFRYFA